MSVGAVVNFTTKRDRCWGVQPGTIIARTKISSLMASRHENDCQLQAERARLAFFLARWRGQLRIDETEGDAHGIELDKRVLDYYLDQYNKLAAFPVPPFADDK